MSEKSDFTFLIALNLSLEAIDDVSRIFQKYVEEKKIIYVKSTYPKYNINAIIPFDNNAQVMKIYQKFLDQPSEFKFFYIIVADEEMKNFLQSEKKTIYFNIKLPDGKSTIFREFTKFGVIKDINFEENSNKGSVTFAYTESALKAKNTLDQQIIDGFPIKIYLNLSNLRIKKNNDFSFFKKQTEN